MEENGLLLHSPKTEAFYDNYIRERFNQRQTLKINMAMLSPALQHYVLSRIAERHRNPDKAGAYRDFLKAHVADNPSLVVHTGNPLFIPKATSVLGKGWRIANTPLVDLSPITQPLRDLGSGNIDSSGKERMGGVLRFARGFGADMIESTASPLGLASLPLPGVRMAARAGGVALAKGLPFLSRGAGRAAGVALGRAQSPLGALTRPIWGVAKHSLEGAATGRYGPTAKKYTMGTLGKLWHGLGIKKDAMKAVSAARKEAEVGTRLGVQSGMALSKLEPEKFLAGVAAVEAGVFRDPRIAKAFLEKFPLVGDDTLDAAAKHIVEPFFTAQKLAHGVKYASLDRSRFTLKYAGRHRNVNAADAAVSAPLGGLKTGKGAGAHLKFRKGEMTASEMRAPTPTAIALDQMTQFRFVATRRLQQKLSQIPEVFKRERVFGRGQRVAPTEVLTAPPGTWERIPNDTSAWGSLAGGYLESNTYKYYQATEGTLTKLPLKIRAWLRHWKGAKTVLNLSVHWANIMSNALMLHASGIPLWRADLYVKAAKAIRNKTPLYTEAATAGAVGLGGETAAARELMQDVLNTEDLQTVKEALLTGEVPSGFKSAFEMFNRVATGKKGYYEKAAAAYQAEEDLFKMVKYVHARESGLDPTKAAAEAQKWIFNYGEVTPFVQKIRSSPVGIPFITYTIKAAPRMAEVLGNNPLTFAVWKNFLDAWNVSVAAHMGIDMRDLAEFKRNQAMIAGEGVTGDVWSFFERNAPYMLLPMRHKDSGAPYMVNMGRFSPLGQMIAPRGVLGFGPVPSAAIALLTGRRVVGGELGAKLGPDWIGEMGFNPESTDEQRKISMWSRGWEAAKNLAPLGVGRWAGKLAATGSPMFQRAMEGALRGADSMGVPGARTLRRRLIPMSFPNMPYRDKTAGEELAGVFATTPSRLDLTRQIHQVVRARQAVKRERTYGMNKWRGVGLMPEAPLEKYPRHLTVPGKEGSTL